MTKRHLLAVSIASLAVGLLFSVQSEAKAPTGPGPTSGGVVNLNTATPQQLRLLPGIGATKARRIATYRNKRRFRAVHELVRVKGIGRRTFRKLKPYVTLKGATTLTEKPKPRTDG